MQSIFTLPEDSALAKKIGERLGVPLGEATFRHFPDGESYVRIDSEVANTDIVFLCGLFLPDSKAMMLRFFSHLAKELGAKRVGLVSPYLGYMRQDKRFAPGEAITSKIFAEYVSQTVDWMVTIDPHLHRHKSLNDIYSVPAQNLHASSAISDWVIGNVDNPVLIGPDEESAQWVSEVGRGAKAPFTVLKKIRHGDRDVEVSVPDVEKYRHHTPVLVDDIISTARTMIETVKHIKKLGMKSPICIGVHAVFAEGAYEALKESGASQVATCNTIRHPSNRIDVSGILAREIKRHWSAD